MTATYSEVLPLRSGMPSGRCAGVPDVMDPEPDDALGIEIAKDVCMSCPVYVRCKAWIVTVPKRRDPGGVIAAMTEAERGVERAVERDTVPPQTCTECSSVLPVTDFAWADHSQKVRRSECRRCVRSEAHARGVATQAIKRAERIARQVAA